MINFKPVQQHIEFFNIVKPLGASISLSSGETVKADVVDILPSGAAVLRIKDSYITVKTEIPLTKENQLLLKVLDVKDNTLRMQIVDVLSKKGETVENISQMIKSNPDLFITSFDNLPPQTQKELLNVLETYFKEIFPSKEIATQTSGYINIQDISAQTLRQAVLNSGIFFERKLLELVRTAENIKSLLQTLPQTVREQFEHSLKELSIKNFHDVLPELIQTAKNFQNESLVKELTKLAEEFKRVAQDIKLEENFQPAVKTSQEISVLTNSLYGFLPLNWEGLKFSDFKYTRKISNNIKSHYFIINLDFEDGKLSLITQLTGEKLAVTLFVENPDLKKELYIRKSELFEHLKNQGFGVEFIEVLPYGQINLEKYV